MSTSRRIIKNMAWMSVAEFATKGVSFVTNAYLARIILEEGFGYINFALATMVYFMAFVTLGLNAIGAREISRSPGEIKKYVNSILSIRIILAVVAFLALAILLATWNVSPRQSTIVLIASMNIISAAILLDWYYQGIEKMNILGLRQIFLAVFNLLGVLFLVKGPKDTDIAMFVLAGSSLLNSAWLLGMYIRQNGMVSFDFDKEFWQKIIRSAIPLTISLLCIAVLSNMNIIMLGVLLPDSEKIVGLFTAVMKIAVLIIIPISVIQIAFYPHFSRSEARESRRKAFERYFVLSLIVGMIATSLIYSFSDFVVATIYGSRYLPASHILKLLMIWIAIGYVSNPSMYPLIAWKKEKKVMVVVLIAAFFNIIFNYFLIPRFGMTGAVWTSIIIEVFIMVMFSTAIIREVGTFPFINIIKIFILASLSSLSGYWISLVSGSELLGIACALVLYVSIIFGFKIVTVSEIKGYIQR